MKLNHVYSKVIKFLEAGESVTPLVCKDYFHLSEHYDYLFELIDEVEERENDAKFVAILEKFKNKLEKGDYDGIDFSFNLFNGGDYNAFFYFLNKMNPDKHEVILPCAFKFKNLLGAGFFSMKETKEIPFEECIGFGIIGLLYIPEKFANDDLIDEIGFSVSKFFSNFSDGLDIQIGIRYINGLEYDDYVLEEMIVKVKEIDIKRKIYGNFFKYLPVYFLFKDYSFDEINKEFEVRWKIFEETLDKKDKMV